MGLDFPSVSSDTRSLGTSREFERYILTEIVLRNEIMIVTTAGTMFELVQALNDGAEQLKKRTTNSISLNAGCELFIAFVTLFPHESDVSNFSSSLLQPPFR